METNHCVRYMIQRFQGNDISYCDILDYDTVLSGKRIPKFRMNVLIEAVCSYTTLIPAYQTTRCQKTTIWTKVDCFTELRLNFLIEVEENQGRLQS
jgi:hypothetical protein